MTSRGCRRHAGQTGGAPPVRTPTLPAYRWPPPCRRPGLGDQARVVECQDSGEFALRARLHPPSPTCATMSSSSQPNSVAVHRNAARSICRSPGKRVFRVDGVTGAHRCGSRQSHTTPRAHRCSSSCPNTRVGTSGNSTCSSPRARPQRCHRRIRLPHPPFH
eukprot:2065518-Pleurochrysis_carterae.AAC.1